MEPENNPWTNDASRGNPYTSGQQQQQSQYSQPYSQQSSDPQRTNTSQAASASYAPAASAFNSSVAPPTQGVRRSDTDFVSSQTDRAAQVEHLQHYESAAASRQTEDDRNQAQLQKEFPNIDSSLIAAIYNERGKDGMGECRELLQELGE